LPFDVNIKLFPSFGGVTLTPVKQLISVAVLFIILHYSPSMLINKFAPKLIPTSLILLLPEDGPNGGSIDVTTAV